MGVSTIGVYTMPYCYELTKKGDNEPSPLLQVDIEMCKHFGVESDQFYYYNNWNDDIGIMLAVGKSFKDLLGNPTWSNNRDILEWLDSNYTVEAWYEAK